MTQPTTPNWKRRKDERPAEILSAALVRHGLRTNLAPIEEAAAGFEGGLAELATLPLARIPSHRSHFQ